MGTNYNPQIVTSGLILSLDPANSKSYDPTTNLFTYSEAFGNAAWSKGNLTVTSNAITGPTVNGVTLVADKLVETAISGQHLISQNPYTAAVGDVNTISVYAKAGERTQLTITSQGEGYVVFNLDTGTIYQTGGEAASIEYAGGGWYRCRATITENEAASSMWYIGMWKNNTNVYLGTLTQGLYVAGAQFERNRNALSPYTKTVASTVAASTTLTDMSGNSNNGTLSNVSFTDSPDYFGFTSTATSTISLGTVLNYTTQDFSFSYWIYLDSYTTSNGVQGPVPFFKGAYHQNGYYCQIATNGAITFQTNQSGANQLSNTAAGTLPLTTWKNICITRSGASAKIYINGIDSTTVSGTHINPASSSEIFRIGSYNQTSGGVFTIYGNMRISNFTGYNTALTADQVLQNFNALRGRYGI